MGSLERPPMPEQLEEINGLFNIPDSSPSIMQDVPSLAQDKHWKSKIVSRGKGSLGNDSTRTGPVADHTSLAMYKRLDKTVDMKKESILTNKVVELPHVESGSNWRQTTRSRLMG